MDLDPIGFWTGGGVGRTLTRTSSRTARKTRAQGAPEPLRGMGLGHAAKDAVQDLERPQLVSEQGADASRPTATATPPGGAPETKINGKGLLGMLTKLNGKGKKHHQAGSSAAGGGARGIQPPPDTANPERYRNAVKEFNPRLPYVDLLIGLLSIPAATQLRANRRREWLDSSLYTCNTTIAHRFVLSVRDSYDSRVLREAQREDDMLFVDAPKGFDLISHKVKLFFDWAIDNYEFRYLLKTDDDVQICLSTLCGALP